MIAAILLIGAMAGVLVLYVTPSGVSVGSDSVESVVSARNLAAGVGLGLPAPSGRFMPLMLHPPLYPLVLTAFEILGVDSLGAARWLNAIIMTAVVVVAGLATYQVTCGLTLSLGVGLLIATWSPLMVMFSGALSEPLFLLLMVATLSLLFVGARGGRTVLVALAGIAAGLAGLARYPGIVLAFVGAAYLLCFARGPWKRKAKLSGIFFVLAVLPLAVWVGHLRVSYGESLGGVVLVDDFWRRITPFRLVLAEMLWQWMPLSSLIPEPPYRMKLAILALFMLLVLVGVASALRRKPNGQHDLVHAAALTGLLAAAYAGLVAVAYAFRVPAPDLDNRTLFVIPFALTGGLLFAVAFALGGWLPSGTRSMILSLVMVGLVGLQLPQAYSTAERLSRNDGGLAGPAWQASCVLNALSELPSGLPLISNETAAVLLYRGVYPHGIPELETRTHLPLETQFGSGASDVEQLFRARQAALVLFDTVIWKLDAMYFGDADARLRGMTTGLEVFEDCQDGTIYLYPLE